MPDVPSALPYKAKVRELIRARGFQIDDVARRIGCQPSTLYAITGRRTARPTGLRILRRLAADLSAPGRPVKVSDICDWTGDDDIESDTETKIPA